MPNQKDAFEERLKRLGSAKAPADAKPLPGNLNAKLKLDNAPPPKSQGDGIPMGMLAFALCLLLLGGGAFGIMLMAPQLIFGDPGIQTSVDDNAPEEDASLEAPQRVNPAPEMPSLEIASVEEKSKLIAVSQPTPTSIAAETSPQKIVFRKSQAQVTRERLKAFQKRARAMSQTTKAAQTPKDANPEGLQRELPMAWTYLPAAPLTWIAVTPEDSPTVLGTGNTKAERDKVGEDHKRAVEDALVQVSSRFIGGRKALENHPHFSRIKGYLSSQPTVRKFRGPQTNRGNIIYVGKGQKFLKVTLTFLPADQALGAPDDPESWGAGILAKMDAQYSSKGVPTSFMRYQGGVSYGKNATITEVKHPEIGTEMHGFDMTLALNHRTTIQVYGGASPETMKRILRGIDHDALLKRVDMMDTPA